MHYFNAFNLYSLDGKKCNISLPLSAVYLAIIN